MRRRLRTTSDGTLAVEADDDKSQLIDEDDDELVMLDVSCVTDESYLLVEGEGVEGVRLSLERMAGVRGVAENDAAAVSK